VLSLKHPPPTSRSGEQVMPGGRGMAGSRLNDRHRACQGKGSLAHAARDWRSSVVGGCFSLGGALGRIKWGERAQSGPRLPFQ